MKIAKHARSRYCNIRSICVNNLSKCLKNFVERVNSLSVSLYLSISLLLCFPYLSLPLSECLFVSFCVFLSVYLSLSLSSVFLSLSPSLSHCLCLCSVFRRRTIDVKITELKEKIETLDIKEEK